MENYPFISVIFFTLTGTGALFVLYRLRSAPAFLYSGKNLPLIFPSLIVLACFTIPMGLGFSETFQFFSNGIQSPVFLPSLFVSTILVLILIYTVFLLVRQRLWSDVSNRRFLFFAILFGLVLKFLYIYLVDMKAISDFELMWNFAVDVGQNGYPESISSIQKERILPYFLPLAWLFGGEPIVYKISNVVVQILRALLTYDLSRRWFDIAVARASLLIVLLVPETFFNSGIPSHDIPGAFSFFFASGYWIPHCCFIRRERGFPWARPFCAWESPSRSWRSKGA
jgi:hypothetical protein